MPQIIVTADRTDEDGTAAVMFRERVNARDFESDHFAHQLLERVGWAVGDAHDADRQAVDGTADKTPSANAQPRRSASVVTTASYTPAP